MTSTSTGKTEPGKTEKSKLLTIIGMILMAVLILTKIVPATTFAGISVFIGIVFFFLVEKKSKTPGDESGLRFNSFVSDIKKPGVIIWIFIPVITGILTIIFGDLIFKGGFSEHVLGRTDSMLSFDKVILLAGQIIIGALGEEIAWRGFFVGKGEKYLPFWTCAIVSSVLFAAGHIAVGNFGLVFYDVATIFIDSMIYAVIYKKTGNCLISTVSHILSNSVGIIIVLFFM